MYINVIESYRRVVAVCDKELLGKKFEEGNKQLHVKESFYKGEDVSEEELKEKINDLVLDDATFNIVGEKTIKIFLEEGIITNEAIGRIKRIPFALILI